MSTRVSKPVVPSTTTPGMAVPTAGSEVTGPATATPVATTGTTAGASPDPGLVPAVKSLREALVPLRQAVLLHLRTISPGDGRRYGGVNSARLGVIPRIAVVLRAHPTVAPQCDPDAIVAGAEAVTAVDVLATELLSLAKQLQETGRLTYFDTWRQSSVGYGKICVQAKHDSALATEIAPVRAALKRGSSIDASVVTTAKASHKVTKAQARVTRAQQGAAAAAQSQTRTVQAHAANTTVRGTSPVPLANPQGPAASADVAPQGPAPGR